MRITENKTTQRQNRFQYISLFSGCGGLDLGFNQAGFRCLGAVDIDETALRVHAENLPGETFVEDLTNGVIPGALAANVDVVVAGSPCQGFSTLGKRKIDDPRNHLLVAGARAALSVSPRVFIAENVISVKSGAHRRYWDDLEALWKHAGYKTTEITIDSRDLGLAQSRRRIFLIAWNTGANADIRQPSLPKRYLREALAGVDCLPNHEPLSLAEGSIEFRIAQKIKPGHKLSDVRNGPTVVHTWDIPGVFGDVSAEEKLVLAEMVTLRRRVRIRDSGDADPLPREWMEDIFGKRLIARLIRSGYIRQIESGGPCIDLRFAFNGKFRRLAWDACSTTVDTRFCNPKYYLHPDEQRGFSTREAARLQGFPDNFIFSGTSHDHVLVGNAVPPPVANYLAHFVFEELLQ